MSGRGRPFRFLAAVTVAWIGARVVMLWPETGSLGEAIRAVVPLARAMPWPAAKGSLGTAPRRLAAEFPTVEAPAASPRFRDPLPDSDPRVRLALMGLIQYGAAEPVAMPAILPVAARFALAPAAVPRAPDRLDPLPDRWSLSAWMVARSGGGSALAPGGQLGGGQAGARVAWMVSPRLRLAAFGRVTASLAGKGREAAIGLEWKPARAPVRFVAEQRFGLDGNPGGTGLGAIAGLDAEVHGFRLEAYGQAGAILRRRAEPYADGAARGTRTVGQSGPVRFALGAGAWGAAQHDAQRLDIGPSATLAVRNLRFALDWRQRVAGEARPGSGLALTVGADF